MKKKYLKLYEQDKVKLTDITSRSALPVYLNKNNLIGSGAEIGVRWGSHANNILQHWGGRTLFLVDTWPEIKMKNYVMEQFKNFKDRCRFMHKSSVDAAKEIQDNSLDFCYIDAAHDYDSVKKDINAWWPRIKKGGVFCGHDYGSKHVGVAKAVDEFIAENKLVMHVDGKSSWYIIKP